ncbi:MAG TPA: hypothetical protein VMT24_09870 [Aggregatilineaceae bacterium]|nr:hypothetical protein [Aggregatilineaceae bacterium]
MQSQHSYSTSSSPIVMDALPWPTGSGFAGTDVWQQHSLSQSERERLDNLMGLALLDQDVHERLLVQRDPSLLDAFDLSEDMRRSLSTIQASTLKEFAQAIVAALMPYRECGTSAAL